MNFIEYENYKVYEDGSIFSNISNKFLKPDNAQGYLQVTLSVNKSPIRIKIHRLVALLFVPNPNNYPIINHIDGNKLNNHFSNLEWCTYEHNNKHARDNLLNNISLNNHLRWENEEFRSKTSKNLSKAIIESKTSLGISNSKFRYKILVNGDQIGREELKDIIGTSKSYMDSLIKRAANGEHIKLFEEENIDIIDTKRES